jgi:hypothetical protein
MKKTLVSLVIMLLAVAAQAQIKMHSDGRITFQTLANTTTQGVSIAPAPNCNVDFNGTVNFHKAALFVKNAANYEWMSGSNNSNAHAKNWVVTYSNWNTENFYVYGNGIAFATNHYTIQNNNNLAKGFESINGEEAVSIINGLNGYYYEPEEQEIPSIENNEFIAPEAVEAMYADFEKRTASLSGSNLEEVFPEAVRTDSQNRLCIDYQSVVTMLVVAVKEQQREIEELRAALEKVEKNK